MSFTVETFDAPAHWASALINGDTTSFDDREASEFEAWFKAHPIASKHHVVDCTSESFIGRFNGLQCELLQYSALVPNETDGDGFPEGLTPEEIGGEVVGIMITAGHMPD